MLSVNSDQLNVELVNHMGDDLAIVNAARVSFDKVSEWKEIDEEGIEHTQYSMNYVPPSKVMKESDVGLINFLAKHNHWTPFAHTAISLRMGAPVPIRTQCFKHKVGLVENEESRRYIKSTPVIYIPKDFRSIPEGSIKQGSAGIHEHSKAWLKSYEEVVNNCVDVYLQMIADGVCPEQARFILPQGAIVNWIWTGNLLAFSNFYNKRTDPTAQKEVNAVAVKVKELVEPLFPVSWKALTSN